VVDFKFGDDCLKVTLPKEIEEAFDRYEENYTLRAIVKIKAEDEGVPVEKVLRGDLGRNIEIDSGHLDVVS